MGESFGVYKLGLDEEAIKYISSANIACAYHAGDPHVMLRTVELAVNHGVGIGVHPGYPDLIGFGRRVMDVKPNEVKNYIIYQVGALYAFTRVKGAKLQHVKPHGQLYNTAAVDSKIARALAEAIYDFDKNLIFMVLANSEMEKAAKEIGLRYASEVFADRNYASNGTLLPRSHPQSVIKDSLAAANRMVKIIKTGQIEAIDGTRFQIKADSICVHGDTPGAIQHMVNLCQALREAGIEIASIGSFI